MVRTYLFMEGKMNKIINSNGPKTAPCVTPYPIRSKLDSFFLQFNSRFPVVAMYFKNFSLWPHIIFKSVQLYPKTYRVKCARKGIKNCENV